MLATPSEDIGLVIMKTGDSNVRLWKPAAIKAKKKENKGRKTKRRREVLSG